jgi:hypothetical protein
MTLVIIFIVSGALLTLFIILKMVQDRFAVLMFWPEAREQFEFRLIERKKRVDVYLERFSIRNFYIILHYFVLMGKSLLVWLHSWLDRKSYRLLNLIRGKQKIDGRGKASYFLHDVTSFRDKFRRR